MTDAALAAQTDQQLDAVLEWLHAKNPDAGEIGMQVDLIENRLVDSLDFMEFVLLLEEISGRENLIDQLSVDHFRTLASIREQILTA